jgi:3',5'-cyclic AMP phosphodiesterase CpdA
MTSRSLTRREVLRVGAGALAFSALGGSSLRAANRNASGFSFVVANDLHYRDSRCGEWLEKVASHIRRLRPAPAFCVLAGDLSEDGTRAQLGPVQEIFRPLSMPVRPIIGNHDYALSGQRTEYERLYGARLNYRFQHGEWAFLGLDTTSGRGLYRTKIPEGTIAWVHRTLSTIPMGQPLVVFTHFPLGRNWLRPLNAHAVIKAFDGHSVRGVFSGHWHGLTERHEHGLSLLTGRCCSRWRQNHDGSPQKGYLLCRVSGTDVTHQFVAVT